ncbi:ATP-binding protein [Alphaproteobacteria bacterium]|nr:ATP-binding protein [Alphaproteobacteria bacterium]
MKREAEFRSQPLVLKSFDRILSHAVGANLVIDMLLTNARKTQAKKDSFLTFEAVEFVREIMETYHFKSDEAERVSLVVCSGFYFRGTEVLMKHVIYNLLKNALKAIKEVSKGKIVIYISAEGKHGRIAVTDNGPGVPLAFQPLLFRPFSTTSQDDTGTGLGLAFCSMAIDDFEGKIQYSDASNGGAEFTIVVPAVEKEDV